MLIALCVGACVCVYVHVVRRRDPANHLACRGQGPPRIFFTYKDCRHAPHCPFCFPVLCWNFWFCKSISQLKLYILLQFLSEFI